MKLSFSHSKKKMNRDTSSRLNVYLELRRSIGSSAAATRQRSYRFVLVPLMHRVSSSLRPSSKGRAVSWITLLNIVGRADEFARSWICRPKLRVFFPIKTSTMAASMLIGNRNIRFVSLPKIHFARSSQKRYLRLSC